jgi:type III secretion system low calcium response chaperone LcrH/SycD
MNEPLDQTLNEEQTEALLEGLRLGATLKDLKGLTPDMMEDVYSFAYRFYNEGRLDDAEIFFRFLCLYDFYNGDYALGLGAVHQMKEQYARAIDLYALAFVLKESDCRPMFHTGQCQLKLGKVALAQECFEFVVKHADEESLTTQAQAYLAAMAAPPA